MRTPLWGWVIAATVLSCGGSAKDGARQAAVQNQATPDAGLDAGHGPVGGANGGSGGGTSSGAANGGSAATPTEIPAPSTGEVTGQDPTLTGDSPHVQLDDFDHVEDNVPTLPAGIPGFFWSGGIGYWFQTLPDADVSDAIIDAVDPPRGGSAKACHLESQSGPAHLWAQLNHPFGTSVDLSRYSALTFWSRVHQGATAIR